MKKIYTTLVALMASLSMQAQGWPANYNGVMLQGFYWNSYRASRWSNLEAQADDLAPYFNLVWIPQSANCISSKRSMGYDDLYWFSNYNSSFGNEVQLRSMIKTFKSKGIGTIADVVINHRNTLTSWTDFPVEKYKGVTYQMYSTDICQNDDGGKTYNWANGQSPKISLSNKYDSGDGWDGIRDLDHYSSNVQTVVKVYLDMLLNDFGYAGFRYDMVKGYAGKFTGIYNTAAKPGFSVGEYWDGNVATVKAWINATKVNGVPTSAAFDFPVRYAVRDLIASKWSNRAKDGLISDATYRQYAVSFVENHDTEYRSSTEQQDPIRKDTLAANAYILASCGTPCVFYKHWQAYPTDIKMMINARHIAGITNTSNTTFNVYVGSQCNVLKTEGSNGTLYAVMGTNANNYTSPYGYTEILRGYHYRYLLSNSSNVAWIDLPSGHYDDVQKARLTAVSNKQGAQLVYTTDGTEPTAKSHKAASGTAIDIPMGTTTLKVGLLTGSTVSAIATRTYEISTPEAFTPYNINVYVNVDQVGWKSVNYWAWEDLSGENFTTKGKWPGDAVTATKTIAGKKWYYKTFRIAKCSDMISFVFNTGTGTSQTCNVYDLDKDTYIEITTDKAGNGYYIVKDVTDQISTGVNVLTVDKQKASTIWYDLQGRRYNQRPILPGVYINGGKKIMIR
ncbi:chitobiase/beta-hexosaminidase C-terminal domain-containing protein [Prevotella stercorea]|uniref:alpha-amylase family glycosyl hydrolase n=1 Tax=Leyella stercorea TaxID=363265 RepID=UPI001F26B493|nr:alpha-amylase family glycosyl hydrolase [Leyella stercorea]MCF2646020.1 chitobiase/beta-hexosaminidase C-terminal domain-containing protein [Leyella stercorea]